VVEEKLYSFLVGFKSHLWHVFSLLVNSGSSWTNYWLGLTWYQQSHSYLGVGGWECDIYSRNFCILALPNLQKPFKVEINVSVYSMELVLIQGGNIVCYHSKIFHGEVLNYPTYDKVLYVLVQAINWWKHYPMGEETIIYTNHQPLQYL